MDLDIAPTDLEDLRTFFLLLFLQVWDSYCEYLDFICDQAPCLK